MRQCGTGSTGSASCSCSCCAVAGVQQGGASSTKREEQLGGVHSRADGPQTASVATWTPPPRKMQRGIGAFLVSQPKAGRGIALPSAQPSRRGAISTVAEASTSCCAATLKQSDSSHRDIAASGTGGIRGSVIGSDGLGGLGGPGVHEGIGTAASPEGPWMPPDDASKAWLKIKVGSRMVPLRSHAISETTGT